MKNMKKYLLVFVIVFSAIILIGCNKEAVMHTVVFANTDLANVEVVDGQTITKPSAPTLADQEFDGWYVDAAFSASFDFSTKINADTTIYAKFSVPVVTMYTVVFANTDLANVQISDGNVLVEPAAPTKVGFEFDDWYSDTAMTISFDFSVAIRANTTIYAKFSVSVNTMHTVVFANTSLANIEVNAGETLERPDAPTKVGYEFDDWYSDAMFTTPYDFDQNVQADLTLYARFSISIPEAKVIAGALEHNTQTSEKFYISGTIKSISNTIYGNLIITNGEEDFVIYGVFSFDGALKYEELEVRPVVGDTVLLYGVLSRFFENLEMKNSFLIKMEKGVIPPVDLTDYTEMTIADGKAQAVDSKIVVEGIVANITYATSMSPNGLFLVDETGAIYVYNYDIAASVQIGDKIKVAGERKNFILETEINQAEKLGYDGAIQLAEAILVSRASEQEDFNKDWIEETTIKELLDTDPTVENITGNIYKVNAFIKEEPGLGFTNFYIYDLDEVTGSYSYSMNNGNDFTWLRQYDGQLKTLYVAVINAKSTTGGLIYRFVPIYIEGDFQYDQEYNPTFAVKYFGVIQFFNEYFFSPSKELITSLSSEKLGFSNVGLTYSSDNTDSVFFETIGDTLVFKTGIPGTAIVTITATHGLNTYFETVEIIVLAEPSADDVMTVSEVISQIDDTLVYVEGIVGPSLVNKTGFYLIDETGAIAVEMIGTELSKFEQGNKVVLKGIKTHAGREYDEITSALKSAGQIAIKEAELVINKFGNHEYSTDSFKTGKTLIDFIGLDKTEEHSTEVYIFDAEIKLTSTAYYSVYSVIDGASSINVYASGTSQLTFLQPVIGEIVTLEFTLVNWNGKNYVGSILSYTFEGVKVINDSNFK